MSTPGPFGGRDGEADVEQYEVVVPEVAAGGAPPAGPYHAPYPPYGEARYGAAASGPPPATALTEHRTPLPKGVWWGLGGLLAAALVILLLVAGGVFTAKDDEDPGANNQATGQYQQPGPTEGQDKLRIVDKASGISYDYLGEGWKDYALLTMIENQGSTVGEYIVTQPVVPGGGEFIAQVTSGPLGSQFGNPDPSGYPTALAAVEESVRGNYYPQPNTPTNQEHKQVTIDGHDAYQRSMDLTWDVEGYDSTGERVVLLLINTGKAAPAFFYCSFPNTHAELYPLIEQVIASIKVDQ